MNQITIIIPTYDRVAKLGRSLRSCINQTAAPARVVVVDNGKNPKTQEVVEQAARDAKFPISYLKSKPFDVRQALITGIMAVETGWAIQLDDDDFLVPQRIENDLRLVRDLPADVVTLEHDFIRVDYLRKMVWVHRTDPQQLTLHNALCIDGFGPPAVATFRMEALVKYHPYHHKDGLTDYDLRASLLAHGIAVGVNQPSFIMDDTKLPQRLTSSGEHMIEGVLAHRERYLSVGKEKGLDIDAISRRIDAQVAFYASKLLGIGSLFGKYGRACRQHPVEWSKGRLARVRDLLPDAVSQALPAMRGSKTFSFGKLAKEEPELMRLIESNYLPIELPKK
jgi:glycosyltransferase involved in cell wall biosynthesis